MRWPESFDFSDFKILNNKDLESVHLEIDASVTFKTKRLLINQNPNLKNITISAGAGYFGSITISGNKELDTLTFGTKSFQSNEPDPTGMTIERNIKLNSFVVSPSLNVLTTAHLTVRGNPALSQNVISDLKGLKATMANKMTHSVQNFGGGIFSLIKPTSF